MGNKMVNIRLTMLRLLILFSGLIYYPASQALTLNGFTRFGSIVELNAKVSGVIQTIKVKPGQRVNKGDVLISLEITPLQASVDSAIAVEKSLLPVVETAQLELQRAEELYDRDSLSQVALKNAENSLAQADGHYQAAIAQRVIAVYQLKNATINSPINGRVLQLHTNIDQFVDPAVNLRSLVTLVKSQQMKAVALIKSEQWSGSLMNKPATVVFGKKQFSGKVSYLGYERIKQSSGLPAYEIHVSFVTDQLIPAEMPVTINIEE